MSNTAKLKKKATELEQKKQFDKALQLYVQLLDEAGRDLDDADLQLYNRVGDLLMRQGNTTEALSYYEKAVDVYAERGFLNNAIALCSKILRQSPARTAVYYKLGKISANKGFKSDAKKNFLEYADRMEKAGQRNEAFRALKEFADLCPDQDDIRLMLAEMLSKDNRKDEALDQLQTLYEKLEGEGRGAEARATVDRMKAIDPAVEPRASGIHRAQKSNDLVFLDLTHELGGGAAAATAAHAMPSAQAPNGPTAPEIPALEGLTFTFVPDDAANDQTTDDFALVESIEGLESSRDESDPLDVDAIEALLTMPDGALSTVEHEAAISAQEDRPPLADLQPTSVSESENEEFLAEPPVELTGWEPTVTDAKHAFTTPVMAPLIEEPVLSGSEFGELALKDTGDARPTPVHDLLLPTELPLLSPPAGSAVPSSAEMHSEGGHMDAVDSPSPINISGAVQEAGIGFDLMSELTSPFARENARDAAVIEASAGVATNPFGIDVTGIEAAGAVASAGESVPPSDASADGEVPPTVAAHEAEPDAGSGVANASHPDDAVPSEVDSDVADGSNSTAPSETVRMSAEQHADAMQSELTEASVDAAFEASAQESPAFEVARPDETAVAEAVQAAPIEAHKAVADEVGLLGLAPGFGDADPEASTFSPSPRLSALTLQPDVWNSDDTPEVLIDGEWHDEHVGDAAHVAPDEAPVGMARFDDLAAAMMWVPSDDDEGDGARGYGGSSDDDTRSPFSTPRGHVSFGGVEDQLRRRLELVPENWALRRQLGEVLLDTGDRDAGLYELDLAMVGYELSGDLLGAMEVADEVVQLVPASVRHHQKRVEYSVRAGDRVRLVDAYMELGDALFREGEPDKAQAVYARVLELSPGHERATFAVGALGPLSDAPSASSLPAALGTTDDAFAEWEPPAHVLASFVSAKSGEQPVAVFDRRDDPTVETHQPGGGAAEAVESPGSDTGPETAEQDSPRDAATAFAADVPSDSDVPIHGPPEVEAESEVEVAASSPAPLPEPQELDSPVDVPIDAASAPQDAVVREQEIAPGQSLALADAAVDSVADALAIRDSALDTESLKQALERAGQPAETKAVTGEAAAAPQREEPSILQRARSMTPVGARDDEFVDLGEWLRLTEPVRTTRMVVTDARPSGDEQADFEDMLRRFKRGVAENVDDEDFASHYDLGVAYKEMGLVDEAIAQFQRALRGESHRIRSYEALGQCFVEKGQHAVATALLQRAADTSQVDDHRLVGVLYLLGYSMEAMGRRTEAMRYYQRVFAVDIEFRDVAQRVAAMEHQPT